MALLICLVPVCPMRAEASHQSEQVSQLLFGELCELLDRSNSFVKIRTRFDGYEGWCQENQLVKTDPAATVSKKIAGDWVNEVMINETMMRVPFGSTLPPDNFIDNTTIRYNGFSIDVENSSWSPSLLKKVSSTFLNTPYLWGGRSVFGIDCSGFTQMVFKIMNIPLLRDASQQVSQGHEVAFLQEVKPGDLAFFDNEAGRITHVGILLASDVIIHASGKVRVDKMDDSGIINSDDGKRTHRLRLIKRIWETNTTSLF